MSADVDIDTTVENIITDRLQVDPAAIDDDTSLTGDAIDADSLDLVEVAEAIHANLGIHIPDDALATLATVGDLKAYVRSERA